MKPVKPLIERIRVFKSELRALAPIKRGYRRRNHYPLEFKTRKSIGLNTEVMLELQLPIVGSNYLGPR